MITEHDKAVKQSEIGINRNVRKIIARRKVIQKKIDRKKQLNEQYKEEVIKQELDKFDSKQPQFSGVNLKRMAAELSSFHLPKHIVPRIHLAQDKKGDSK
jgi:hypothetical protein